MGKKEFSQHEIYDIIGAWVTTVDLIDSFGTVPVHMFVVAYTQEHTH